MASNDVYSIYKRNGISANKANSGQTRSLLNSKAKNENQKSNLDNNIINACESETQQESHVLENVILLSNDGISNENTKFKCYSRKHLESCVENKSNSTNQEIIMLDNNNVNGQDAKYAIIDLEEKNDDCKDDNCNIVYNIVDVVVQNLLDVAIINSVSINAKSKILMSDNNKHDSKCELEYNHSNIKSILPLIEINGHNCSKKKSELEQEMELYETFEKNEEAQLINCDSHDLVREESIIAIEPQNKKKRALEGCFYERKRKRNKCEQILVAKTKNDEDVCFICFDGGDLVLCDHRLCPKAYHLNCIGRDKAFFSKKGAWFCGSHFCLNCKKSGTYQCYTCPTSFCKQCVNKSEFCIQNKRNGLCEECLPIVNMIEHNKTINNEGEQVDFEDKETYEYLFKEYWIELKKDLSIVISNLDYSGIELKNIGDCQPIMQNNINNEESDVGSNEASSSSHASFRNLPIIEGKQNKDDVNIKEMSKTNAIEETLNNESIYKNKDSDKSHQSPNNDLNQGKKTFDKEASSKIEGWASRELKTFLENMKEDVSKPLTRFAVHKLLWMYIKKHKLQNPKKVSDIICDKQLRLIFEKESIGQFEMFKLLNKHFPTKDSSNHSKKTIIAIDKQKVEDNLTSNATSQEKIRHGILKIKRKAQKYDEISQRPKSSEYAAINYKNISLIYLKRSILEEFVVDSNFDSKVVGTFVKIRVPGNSKMDSCYRLVLVIGTSVQKESYMVGLSMTNATLLILNLQKKESITIDVVSNQDFTEEECKRLRLNIKCGFLKTFTVGQLEEKATSLQEAKVNDWMENERQRLINLRDRASEKGQKRELRECVEKLQELNNPSFRIEKVKARPRIFADPHMDPSYESDDGNDYGEGNTQLATNQLQTINSHSTRQSWESNFMEDYKSKHNSNKILANSQNEEINKGVLDTRPIEAILCQITSKPSIAMSYHTQNKEAKPHWNDKKEKPLSHDKHNSNINLQKRTRELLDPRAKKDQVNTKLVDYIKDAKKAIGTTSAIAASNDLNSYKSMHVSLVPTELVKLNNSMDHEKLWQYVDPFGTTQGPFSMEQLQKWNGTGLFPIDLRIWKATEEQNQSILLIDGLQGKFNTKHDHVCQVVERTNDECQTSISTTQLNSRHNEIEVFQKNIHIMTNDLGLEILKPQVLTQSSQAIHDVYVANHIKTPPYDKMSQNIENLHKTFLEINTIEGYNNIDENQSFKSQIDPKMPCKFHIQGCCWKGKTCGYWHN